MQSDTFRECTKIIEHEQTTKGHIFKPLFGLTWQRKKISRCSVLIPTLQWQASTKAVEIPELVAFAKVKNWIWKKGPKISLPSHTIHHPCMEYLFSPAYIFSWFLWCSCRYIYQSHGLWICHVKHPPMNSCVKFFRQVCVKLPLPRINVSEWNLQESFSLKFDTECGASANVLATITNHMVLKLTAWGCLGYKYDKSLSICGMDLGFLQGNCLQNQQKWQAQHKDGSNVVLVALTQF